MSTGIYGEEFTIQCLLDGMQHFPWISVQLLAILNNDFTIDDNMDNTFRKLVGFFVCGFINHCIWIENYNICPYVLLE
jgi:hypothetical protein